jgi:zinc transport system substrate-binding protein
MISVLRFFSKWMALLALCFVSYAQSAQAITVVASLPALGMVADQLLQGVGKSVVLVDGRQSPHGMALSPSQRLSLSQADLVLWVGADMESWLVKPLQQMKRNHLAMTDLPHLPFLPATAAQQAKSAQHDHGQHGAWDMHLWLDPSIMQTYIMAIRDELMLRDPQHSRDYEQNAELLLADLDAAIIESKERLAPMKGVPLLVMHDAWRYFFRFFNLTQGGVVQRTPEENATMLSMASLERQLTSGRIGCVLREPQINAKSIAWLKQHAPQIKEALTDPLGFAGFEGGYPAWLREQAKQIAQCR